MRMKDGKTSVGTLFLYELYLGTNGRMLKTELEIRLSESAIRKRLVSEIAAQHFDRIHLYPGCSVIIRPSQHRRTVVRR